MDHGQCPMTIMLQERQSNRGQEAIAERPDGTRVPFIAFSTPLYDASGTLVGAVNMLVDATDRIRVEEYAQRLAAIVEFSDDSIISQDMDGIITSWNRGADRLFGYTVDEAVGKPITMLIPEDRHREDAEILQRIRRGERVDHYVTVRRHKDGSLVDISLSASPIKNTQGEIVGVSKIARNVTDRRRAEDYAQRLAAIVESSEDAILSKNLDGIIMSWNQGAERLFGYTADEGRSPYSFRPNGRTRSQ